MKWEYLDLIVNNDDLPTALSDAGENEWELVQILEWGWGSFELRLICKRPWRDGQPLAE